MDPRKLFPLPLYAPADKAGGEGDQDQDTGDDFDADAAGKGGLLSGVKQQAEEEKAEGEEEGSDTIGAEDLEEDGKPKDKAKEGDEAKLYRPKDLADHLLGKTDQETIDKLQKAYNGARQELAKKGKAVAKPEDYKLEAKEGEPDADLEVLAAEDNKPLVDAFRQIGVKHHLTQQQFEGVLRDVIGSARELGLDSGAKFDIEAEMAVLGGKEKALPVMRTIATWGENLHKQGQLSAEELAEFKEMAGTGLGLKVMNKLRAMTGEQPIPTDTPFDELGGMSQEEWYDAVGSERYDTDAAYRRKIDAIGAKLFGTDAGMTSPRGVGVRPRKAKEGRSAAG